MDNLKWNIRVFKAIQCLGRILILSATYSFLSIPAHSASIEGIPLYFKNMQLTQEHKQKIAADLHRYHNADNLWDALREDFTLPHYENVPVVQEKIEWYMSNQEYLLRSASRAGPYLYYILQEIKKRHLPAELVLLPIVESGYNPFSLSNMGAAGIWQLMPGTASSLGVKQDWWYDGRRDVIASTRAALNYLIYLQDFFEGNWLLAIAAYNTGEGNVLAAIKRNIRERKRTNFWSLPLAQQTKDYVPSVLALATIISHPEQYPIYFPPIRNAPYLAQVDVGTQINLKFAAALAGISYKQLMRLNPGFNRIATSKKGPYKLILPIENVEQFAENIAMSSLNSRLRWMHYKIKQGDTLLAIAKKFNSSILALRQTNHLNNNIIHPGSDLLIPNSLSAEPESALEILKIADKRKVKPTKKLLNDTLATKLQGKYILQPGDTIYMTRVSDTIDKLSKRFKVNPQLLQAVNHIKSGKLQPGKQIIIPTHAVMMAIGNLPQKTNIQERIYLVKRGDTIERIARRFGISSSEIRLANLMTNNILQEGDRITIPTHYRG